MTLILTLLGCSSAADTALPPDARELKIFCEATNHHADVADPQEKIIKIVGEVTERMVAEGLPTDGGLLQSFATMTPASRKAKVEAMVEEHGLQSVCKLALEDLRQ